MFKSTLFVLTILCIGLIYIDCNNKNSKKEMDSAFEILDDEAYNIFSPSAQLAILDSGFTWTEGPLWLNTSQQLLFNDIPPNTTYSWSESKGTKVYLNPSGYTQNIPRGGEPGANGLLLDSKGQLVLCQHGDRRMATMNSTLDSPVSDFVTLIDEYKGKKFNSPNDAVFSKAGNLYFTDPPYGLAQPDYQEMPFNGVYRYSSAGKISLIDSTLTRPNGIAFAPDEKTLYVANSDPAGAIWMQYSIDEKTGNILNKSVFYDATEAAKIDKGLPDGLKVNDQGYIFASGPGGIWVFNPAAKCIAKIRTGQATSNCAFGADQNTLFLTADDYLMKATFK
ncbi:MAG: SMP-30/gluconolactonase/LRE family protein [Saprospiraceae bacterium]|nr:SMP-30/gluconolactonase/LRE family protein [Saprospiraceae bacterium]